MSGKHCGLVNDEWIAPPRIQDALSTLLKNLGFNAMAQDVLTEGDKSKLKHYARIIAKQMPDDDHGRRIISNLRTLGLI